MAQEKEGQDDQGSEEGTRGVEKGLGAGETEEGVERRRGKGEYPFCY